MKNMNYVLMNLVQKINHNGGGMKRADVERFKLCTGLSQLIIKK